MKYFSHYYHSIYIVRKNIQFAYNSQFGKELNPLIVRQFAYQASELCYSRSVTISRE